MDPQHAPASCPVQRLPRARGDGPRERIQASYGKGAPPRTRGWTIIIIAFFACIFGSPAHAGMDRIVSVYLWPLRRLPRARGDGPPRGYLVNKQSKAPPRTRGWTHIHPNQHLRR